MRYLQQGSVKMAVKSGQDDPEWGKREKMKETRSPKSHFSHLEEVRNMIDTKCGFSQMTVQL